MGAFVDERDNKSYRRFDNQAFVLWYHTDKMYGFSVRCVEDQ